MTLILERGGITFLYRPRVDEPDPDSAADVQRLYAILAPRDRPVFRRLVIGRKRLPDVDEHERSWAYVERVGRRAESVELRAYRYLTKTRGEREQPAARSAGEGIYAILEHDDHAHLSYTLEQPRELGDVQRDLNIEPEASFIVAVRNPEVPVEPPQAGLVPGRRARYPQSLHALFEDRRFAPLHPDFLDHEGAELILIGARHSIESELADDRV